MPGSAPNPQQIATGDYIAQASDGGTASVQVNNALFNLEGVLQSMSGAAAMNLPPASAFQLIRSNLNLEPPLAPDLVLHRGSLEKQVTDALNVGKSVALRGDVGSGRTELARAARRSEAHTGWTSRRIRISRQKWPWICSLVLSRKT